MHKPILLAVASVLAVACNTTFQDACHTASGAFAARYTLTDGPSGACDAATSAELAALKGDILGMQWYEYDHYNRDPKNDRNTLAIKANALGVVAATYAGRNAKDVERKPYALGTFTTAAPGADNFCAVDTLEPAEQILPAVAAVPPDPAKPGDKGAPALVALALKYEWSAVRTFVDPVVSGSEVVANLAYTKNGCTAKYRVVAVYPYVSCLDKDKKPSDVMCDPDPKPEQGHPVGSGLHVPVRCDASLGFCVLVSDEIP